MASIELSDTELGQLMFILANAEFKNGVTWAVMNPLIAKIGAQVRTQQHQRHHGEIIGDGREVRDEQR